MTQNILIIGATSAIASACSLQWVQQGANLYLIGRNPNRLQTILDDLRVRAASGQIVAGEVADINVFQQHRGLIERAEMTLGGLDVVLIAHGTLPNQKACEASVEKTLDEIQTNALSVVALLTLLADDFEKKRRGVLAVISSVAGDRGRQSNYVYGAAKGMVSLFAQGLRNRLAKSGVSVVVIKPGFVDTPMTAGFDKKGPLWSQPETVAAGILKAVADKQDDVYLPGFWRWIMAVIRHIPERIFKRLSL
jgi:hypothetical protein